MKTLKHLTFVLFGLSIMFACESNEFIPQDNLYNFIEKGEIFVDSALSKKQKQAYKKLMEVVAENLKLQDSEFVFMNKRDFLSKGFPETLYDKFARDIESANAVIVRDSVLLNEFKEKFPAHVAKMRKKAAEW
jgi:hypothetical protein